MAFPFTKRENEAIKRHIISELPLSSVTQKTLLQKLKDYKYIDEMHHFRIGSFIRWISLLETECNDDINLNRGAILCNVVITSNGVNILVKNMYSSKLFTLTLDNNVFFQKLNKDEQLIMLAMNSVK